MKTEELTAIGLNKEQAEQVFALYGKDIAGYKKIIGELEAERDGYKSQLETAGAALEKFDGIDPEKIRDEIETYKKRAEEAELDFKAQIVRRDQKDWLSKKLDEYGVLSPYARIALVADCMSDENGLKWHDGCFDGFDDFMRAAKEKDAGLYLTEEEKLAVGSAAKHQSGPGGQEENPGGSAPRFTGPADSGSGSGTAGRFVPPRII